MTGAERPQFDKAWIDDLRGRVLLSALVARHLPLKKAGREHVACCPFHSEKTPSFTVNDGKGFYHCFGCGAHGDAIRWEMDHNGKRFADAVIDLADSVGLPLPDGVARHPGRAQAAAPDARVQRQSVKAPARDDFCTSEEMGGVILARLDNARRAESMKYLAHRGVALSSFVERLNDIRFCPNAPIGKWRRDRGPDSVGTAPAMVARVRRPDPALPSDQWPVTGLHITYLNDACTGKMERNGKSGPLPARKMLGEIQGSCVVLGQYRPGSGQHLVVGEGIESTLSGLQLIGAGADACAIAALALNNLQGYSLLDGRGALPLWNLRPDPARDALFFAHDGPVTVLVDADMKPIRVRTSPVTRKATGPKIAEAARGPYVIREISGPERADICARQASAGWRAAGVAEVTALRPRIGCDFNDVGRV